MVYEVAKDKRVKALTYGEPKKPRQFTITDEASSMLDQLSEGLEITRSELVERMIRALHATQDPMMINAFLARGSEGSDRHD